MIHGPAIREVRSKLKGRFLLDCLGLVLNKQRGSERHVCNLLRGLAGLQDDRFVILANQSCRSFVEGLFDRDHFLICPVSGHNRGARLAFQTSLGPLLTRLGRCRLYVTTSVFPAVGFACPVVALVHDLMIYHFPDSYPLGERLFRWALLQASLRLVDGVITLSSAAAEDISRVFRRLTEHCVHTVPCSVDTTWLAPRGEPADLLVLERLGLKRQGYVLSVLGAKRYKNQSGLAAAATELIGLGHGDLQVVAVGDCYIQLNDLALPQNLKTLGFVDDDTLRVLYHNAAALVFPTFFEGFGIPVIEAQAVGLPVVCSDLPVLQEVSGGAAFFVDATSPGSIAAGILRATREEPGAARQIRDGLANAARFNVARTTTDFTQACEDLSLAPRSAQRGRAQTLSGHGGRLRRPVANT
jgi:glycosyltransferase involved in cell wall biosynthesis